MLEINASSLGLNINSQTKIEKSWTKNVGILCLSNHIFIHKHRPNEPGNRKYRHSSDMNSTIMEGKRGIPF